MKLTKLVLPAIAVLAIAGIALWLTRDRMKPLKCEWGTGSPETRVVTLTTTGGAVPVRVGQHQIIFPPAPVDNDVEVTVSELSTNEVGFEVTPRTGGTITFKDNKVAQLRLSFDTPRCPAGAPGRTIYRDSDELATTAQGKVLHATTPGTSKYMIAE
jgi:hypothetical protein